MRKAMVIVLTVLNVLLLIGSIVCTALTYRNNKIINSTEQTFAYREEGGGVLLTLQNQEEIRLQFESESVKIIQSYKHNDTETIFQTVQFVHFYAQGKGYEIERDVTEMYGEIRLHNILYNFGYKRERTGDCDLDYTLDRRWYVNAASKLIGWIGL
mgnify:FL=1